MTDRPNVTDPGRIVAHRGASQVKPENTPAAMREAARQGVWWVEFDVSLLGDGTLVTQHDATLDRCTNRTGRLASLGVEDLEGIDAGDGEPLATLDQMLDVFEELDLFANLEMKPHDAPKGQMAEAVHHALSGRGWARERIITSSFAISELEELRAMDDGWPIAVLFGHPRDDWPEILSRLDAAAIHVDFDQLSVPLIERAIAESVDIRTYTINDPDRAEVFRDAGLTGVITDHPPLYLDRADWRAWMGAPRRP